METRGQMQDRQRELKALDTIAAAMALPELRHALDERRSLIDLSELEHAEVEAQKSELRERIGRAEATLGIPQKKVRSE